ncbi:MAG TPA: hypothetical protein PK760_09675 [Flavobacteriales bacterium]|nr:hypothetical protein [Flavobacteriales bacterium]
MAQHTLLSIIACMAAGVSFAQVRVDKPIILNGASDTQRQLNGLTTTTAASSVINAEQQLAGQHRTTQATQATTWSIDLPALTAAPTAGTQIMVQAPASPSAGPLLIQVNGSGSYAVLIDANDTLNVGTTSDAPLLSLVFDGNAFRLMNGRAHARRSCPSDMVAVNGELCIDVAKSDSLDWYEAGRLCVNADKRLCTWGEWHAACTQAALLGLQQMIGEWEWTNNAANEDGWVRSAGGASCTTAGTLDAVQVHARFRCCMTR